MNKNLPKSKDLFQQRTRTAFLWSHILRTPFWAIYGILPFILREYLSATQLQITVMITLKPMVSIFAVYWSGAIHDRQDRIHSNIILAGVLGLIPFFFCPFVDSPWFFVASFGLYMFLYRGVIPAWMELMKQNLPFSDAARTFSFGKTLGFLLDGVFAVLFAMFLDGYIDAWRWIFPFAALVSLFSVIFILRVPKKEWGRKERQPVAPVLLATQAVQPLKDVWNLMSKRPDFRGFQVGFMLGGTGLMMMIVVLPVYFMDVLKLSFTELTIAFTLCKGIGYALTAKAWSDWFSEVDIYRFSSGVTALCCVFPLLLLAAKLHLFWLYAAYIVYGVMQAGSELSWNMSGPVFSRHENSSLFSSVNVLTVGLRGCFAPALGTSLLYWTSPGFVILAGGALCLAATVAMASYSRSRGALFEPSYEIGV